MLSRSQRIFPIKNPIHIELATELHIYCRKPPGTIGTHPYGASIACAVWVYGACEVHRSHACVFQDKSSVPLSCNGRAAAGIFC